MAYIYEITNSINDKVYVGATTTSIKTRMRDHRRCARKECKTPIYIAMHTHGIENFTIRIIEECDNNIRFEREKYWIKELDTTKNGYNITLGGMGGQLYEHEEIKKKLIETGSSYDVANAFGCYVDTARKIARKEKLNIQTDKERQYASFSKPVIGIMETGEQIKFKSSHYAALYCVEHGAKGKSTSVSSHIADACKGKRKQAYGVNWKYA